ncbi:4Fe-4S ferredoxin-type domain-containing protein [Gammaproteobacteria bacterium]
MTSKGNLFGQNVVMFHPHPQPLPRGERGENIVPLSRFEWITSVDQELTRLVRKNEVQYRAGRIVLELTEKKEGVVVTSRDLSNGNQFRETYDYVFLAAGAIGSTRIVLQSLRNFDTPVDLKHSQKFIIPMIQLRGDAIQWPEINAFASLFLDFQSSELSPHWIHGQISVTNDYVMARLGISPFSSGWQTKLAKTLFRHLLIGWCGIHSNHSSSIRLTLSSEKQNGQHILKLIPQQVATSTKFVKRALRIFGRITRQAGAFCVYPMLQIGAPGSGNHIGGTLPMRRHPESPLDTDVLGRLNHWHRVHIVDGSVFPSIPATTVALTQMANADRIASAVPLEG